MGEPQIDLPVTIQSFLMDEGVDDLDGSLTTSLGSSAVHEYRLHNGRDAEQSEQSINSKMIEVYTYRTRDIPFLREMLKKLRDNAEAKSQEKVRKAFAKEEKRKAKAEAAAEKKKQQALG
jgi:hypothetical protein